jgi:transcription elongation factor Elf1
MRLCEYIIECYHCDAETNVTILDSEDGDEPAYCPMCGEPAQSSFIDAMADSDD